MMIKNVASGNDLALVDELLSLEEMKIYFAIEICHKTAVCPVYATNAFLPNSTFIYSFGTQYFYENIDYENIEEIFSKNTGVPK